MNTRAFTLGEYRSQLTLKISTYPNGNLAIKLYEKDHGILIDVYKRQRLWLPYRCADVCGRLRPTAASTGTWGG